MSGLCSHGQNPNACVSCWRLNPTRPPEPRPEPPPRAEVVHLPCDCRLAVRGYDVIRWDKCEEHENTTQVPRWFWMAAKERQLPGYEGRLYNSHTLEERATCLDPTCERAWASKERGKRQA